MYKVLNIRLAGQHVVFSHGVVDFDKDGIGDIENEKVYEAVLELANFSAMGEHKEDSKDPVAPPKEVEKVITPVSVKAKK